MSKFDLSRRDFLKLASAGSLAFALSEMRLDRVTPRTTAPAAIKQGRITFSGSPLYNAPTFNAKKIHNFGADQVVEITAVDENGERGNPHNSTWYKINGEGYTYSGWVQPVETNYQTAQRAQKHRRVNSVPIIKVHPFT